ncbi:alpha/beta fold hydrolase [Massilia horti]|uniref:alpha/beta fold hydrolase n=1 Tax=Massilia horti TaxID=2562153 RepID=UPI001E5BC0F1|nr:alpha/beta fold hydrolase [Massilia horti]
MKPSLIPCAVLSLLASTGALAASPASERPCHLPGAEETLRCMTVAVALDHRHPDGATLPLHVTVAPSFRERSRPDPLFVLAGGPGEAGSDVLPLLSTAFRRLRATRDIVFIDQRGTGLSGKLDCDTPGEEDPVDAQADKLIRDCIARSKAPFAAYTTEAAARDIEQVRRALGYRQINLWGGSYGTRLGQAYARAFPASVRTLVLDGVAAPDQVIPAGGRDAQAALDKLFEQCAADSGCRKAYPDLKAEFTALVEKLAAADVKVAMPDPRTARQGQTVITRARFLGTVRNMLYIPGEARRLPFLVHSAFQGRWEPFVARQNLATDYASSASTAMLLHLAVVCAEDMPRLTPALMTHDAAPLTRPVLERMPALCEAMKVPPVPWREPGVITAPTLLLSGALDPVTPPHRAASAARHIAHAQQVVAANAGHGVSSLGCAPRLLREFLDSPRQKLDAACLSEIPAPTFQLGNAGPQP